jgi:uncharacterized membrane protein
MIPNRAPRIGQYCFPLCWRCTAIISGILLTDKIFHQNFFYDLNIYFIYLSAFIIISPAVIDSINQYFRRIESTNFRRISTGMLCGAGMQMIAFVWNG